MVNINIFLKDVDIKEFEKLEIDDVQYHKPAYFEFYIDNCKSFINIIKQKLNEGNKKDNNRIYNLYCKTGIDDDEYYAEVKFYCYCYDSTDDEEIIINFDITHEQKKILLEIIIEFYKILRYRRGWNL